MKTKIFIHENAFENVVCEVVAILSWGDELNTATSHGEINHQDSWWGGNELGEGYYKHWTHQDFNGEILGKALWIHASKSVYIYVQDNPRINCEKESYFIVVGYR